MGLVRKRGEADDLIAAKVGELSGDSELVIVSADKDLGQLVKPVLSYFLHQRQIQE